MPEEADSVIGTMQRGVEVSEDEAAEQSQECSSVKRRANCDSIRLEQITEAGKITRLGKQGQKRERVNEQLHGVGDER